jgi:hypothetical protein
MVHMGWRRIGYLLSSASWQVVAVCVIVAYVATVNAYPGYYGHGGHDYISGGFEEEKHVSITEWVLNRSKAHFVK